MSCHASHPEPSWNIFMGPYNIDFNNYRLLCEIWDPDKNWDCQKPKRFWMTLAVALKSGKCSIRLDRGCSSVVYTPREVAMSISRSARTAILGDQVDGRVQHWTSPRNTQNDKFISISLRLWLNELIMEVIRVWRNLFSTIWYLLGEHGPKKNNEMNCIRIKNHSSN